MTRAIRIAAPIEAIFEAITDYERYPRLFAKVCSATVVARRGPDVEVRYEASFLKTVRYTLLHHEERPGRMSWTLVTGDYMQDNRGSWQLEAQADGTTRTTYQVELTPHALVPAPVVNVLVERGLPQLMESVRRSVERR